jgi:hypothetical protein
LYEELMRLAPPRHRDLGAATDPEEAEAHLDESPSHAVFAEEVLIPDARAGLRPSELVERKLIALLQRTPVPVGHRARSHAA